MQLEAFMAELRYCPTPHSAHSIPALPASQDWHVVLPVSGAYLPKAQCWHMRSAGPPANVLTAHGLHSACPVRLLVVPGTHGRQTVWPVPFWCVPAAQAVHRVALASFPPRTYPRGQAVHWAPIEVPNRPAVQDTQAVLPSPGE